MRLARISVSIMALAALSVLSLAQQKDASSDKQKQDSSKSKQKQEKQEEQSIFKNRLGYKSSKTTKETTTLAFNGVDPDGKVGKETLAKVPADADRAKVQAMAQDQPTPEELRSFLLQGGLKEK